MVLDKIKGQPVHSIGRTGDMLCLEIGNLLQRKGWKGEPLAAFALHCQCSWRLIAPDGEILVASADVYEPPTGVKWTESFAWDKKGNNLFDEKVGLLTKTWQNVMISSVEIGEANDLVIGFSNRMLLETFTDSSHTESWRVIMRAEDESAGVHIVAIGNELHTE